MTAKESLGQLLNTLPEERLRQLLTYAEFLAWHEERGEWRRFGQQQLARAYGPDSPNTRSPTSGRN